MRLELERSVKTRVEPSPCVLRVAAMFGLGVDEQREAVIVPRVSVDIEAGQIVFVTGPSGGGKSVILRLIEGGLEGQEGVRVVRFDGLAALGRRPLVDSLAELVGDEGLEGALRVLSLAGLSDAFVMLRRPSELSDGQRYRLRLAQAMAEVRGVKGDGLCVVLADEFCSVLDRVTAKVIARNVRKWTRRDGGVCFVAATAHDDLLEPLEPDVLVVKDLGERIEVMRRGDERQGR